MIKLSRVVTREDNAQCPYLHEFLRLFLEPQSAWNVRLDRRTGGMDLDVL